MPLFKKHSRRKAFLIDSNQKVRRKPKLMRNRWLNFLMRLFFLRHLFKLFRASVLFSLFCVLMLGFVLFAVFSPFFELKKITVVRDNPHINVEAIQQSLETMYGRNMIFLTEGELAQVLQADFPEFRSVDIKESWPDEIEVRVTVSPALFTLFNKETANFSTISEDGIILEQSPREDLNVIEVYEYDKLILPRVPFSTKEELQKVVAAQFLLTEKLKLEIKEIRLFYKARELHFVTSGNIEIWIDLQQDIDAQIRKLDLAASRIGIYTDPLHHVDLRVPDHLFWE